MGRCGVLGVRTGRVVAVHPVGATQKGPCQMGTVMLPLWTRVGVQVKARLPVVLIAPLQPV